MNSYGRDAEAAGKACVEIIRQRTPKTRKVWRHLGNAEGEYIKWLARWAFHWAALACLLLCATTAHAQTATPSQKFVWTQSIDAATAQAYAWKVYNDGATTGVTLTPVTCVANTPATTSTCSVPIPAYTPGPHSITITATNAAGESPKSDPLAFTFVAIPAKPGTPSIQ